MALNAEATRQLNFLAGCPMGNTTMKAEDLKEVLLHTGGNMLAQGRLYNFKTKHLGVGVYRVELELANP